MRNVRYKAKLLTYQAKHLEGGTKALSARAVTDPTAKALLTTSQLETGNLKRELERLAIYVKSLEEQIDAAGSRHRHLPQHAGAAGAAAETSTQLGEYELRFVRTCQALRLLLSHLNVIVEIDPRTQRILDKSKRRENVIVDKEIAAPFFEWLDSNGGAIDGSKA
ncbi:MAG: hypothetical protein JSS56_08860 [Proteobacteria bacterium]|nr:hypothetical protein [Pseudomonadota bacterium]